MHILCKGRHMIHYFEISYKEVNMNKQLCQLVCTSRSVSICFNQLCPMIITSETVMQIVCYKLYIINTVICDTCILFNSRALGGCVHNCMLSVKCAITKPCMHIRATVIMMHSRIYVHSHYTNTLADS